jgi:serine/threonine-protein kinase
LPPPRKFNPAISPRTERGILWAMELHPDDRPETAENLRQFLLGTRELPIRSQVQVHTMKSIFELFKGKPEQILLWTTAGLLLVSFIASLIP